MAENLRRGVPVTGDAENLAELLDQLYRRIDTLERAAARSVPRGFNLRVERLDDGHARVFLDDIARATSLTIGEF
jgi:hypothetical protein